jgi:hypothetical protein
MATVWERVMRLEGRTLSTLKYEKPFKIVEVTTDRVRLVPQSGKRTRRNVRRDRIEFLVDLRVNRDELRQAVQREYPKSQNTSYYAAIVDAIG